MADEELKDEASKAADAGESDGAEPDAAPKAIDEDSVSVVKTDVVEAKDGAKTDSDQTDADDKTKADDGEADDDDDLDLPMDEINALLSATPTDRKGMSAQMRRVAQREAESQKRVEETVKNTKANPRWFVPLFCTLLIVGMLWAVIYYLTSSMGNGGYPIPALKQWNLLVAFVIMMVGFIMTVAWH